MLAILGEIVRQVALIALLAAILEMLLPKENITRYVRLVLGLFVIVSIISPLVEGLRFGPELNITDWVFRSDYVTAAPVQRGVQRGEELRSENEEIALDMYRERLAGQIKALISLVPEVKSAEVLVNVGKEFGYRGAIQLVVVVATLGDKPIKKEGGLAQPEPGSNSDASIRQNNEMLGINDVRISIKTGAEDDGNSRIYSEQDIKQVEARIIEMISHFYGLGREQIEVRLLYENTGVEVSGGGIDESK